MQQFLVYCIRNNFLENSQILLSTCNFPKIDCEGRDLKIVSDCLLLETVVEFLNFGKSHALY